MRWGATSPREHAAATLPLDLLRYSAPGVHDLTAGFHSYFSPDGGVTSVNIFNGVAGFDQMDWAGYTYDTFDAFMTPGHEYDFSSGDIELLDALGYMAALRRTRPPPR